MKPAIILSVFIVASFETAAAQTGSMADVPSFFSPRLLPQIGLPFEAAGFRSALPGMFDQTGHERRTLTGTVTSGGVDTPFSFTRELDQLVRLDLGTPARSVVVHGLNTLSTPLIKVITDHPSSDDAILEVLAEDMPEAFLFSFGTTARIRWLGGNYRAVGEASMPEGTRHEVFARTAVSGTQAGAPERVKVFLFDSSTKLLALTRYQVDRGGASVEVEVLFGGWTTLGGQMAPTSIIRSENGQEVFTINIKSATSSATQADTFFGVQE